MPAWRDKIKGVVSHKVAKNFGALASTQVLGYLLPLVTFPYIIRVVGIGTYGRLAFANAVVAYFIMITDYGFTLTATRNVAANRGNTGRLVEIYSAVITTKFVLMLACLAVFSVAVLTMGKPRHDATLLFVTFGAVLGNVFMPMWFFQGVQQMGYITLLDLSSKTVFAALLILLVKAPSDYLLIPALTSVGAIASGIAGMVIIKRSFGIGYRLPSRAALREQLDDGWHVFTSRLCLNFYTTTNTVVLGFFTSQTVVGNYAIAEKIVILGRSLFDVASQALYPHCVDKWQQGAQVLKHFLDRLIPIMLSLSLALALLVFLCNPLIVLAVTGSRNQDIIRLVSLMSVALVLSPVGGMYSNVLVTMNRSMVLSKITARIACLNAAVAWPAIWLYGAPGLAAAYAFVISVQIVYVFIMVRKSFRDTKRDTSPEYRTIHNESEPPDQTSRACHGELRRTTSSL